METGEISKKLKRGKHTTRHSQVIPVGHDTYLMDTPGFSSLYLTDIEEQELKAFAESCLKEAGVDWKQIRAIASIDKKKDEKAILKLAAEHGSEKVGKEIRKLYSWSDEDKLINN